MADPNIKARLTRLLRGELGPDDLSRLFLFARDRCDGREAVQEIGDFVAHHTERTKGLVTRDVRDWFTITWFMVPKMNGYNFDANRLPAGIREYLPAAFRRIPKTLVRDKIGLRMSNAEGYLRSILKNLKENDDGTFAFSRSPSKTEIEIFQLLLGTLVARPAFTSERLVSELQATLRSQGLLEKREEADFSKLSAAISIYAVSVMHNCTVSLGADRSSKLTAKISGNNISVSAAVPLNIVLRGGGKAFITSDIFHTDLRPNDYCSDALLRLQGTQLLCPIELSVNGRLDVLQ